jgi:hypothetical protein
VQCLEFCTSAAKFICKNFLGSISALLRGKTIMLNILNRCSILLITVMFALTVQTAFAKSTARVARTVVNIADSLQITFETDQDVSDQPDFSALASNFDILATSKNTSISIQNGRMQRSTSWQLEVLPRREGNLLIPAITIGNEQTNEISITVDATARSTDQPLSDEISLEIDVDNLAPYVQGQLIYTVRIVHTVSFDQASLSEPAIANGDAIIEKLGDDVAYESSRGTDRVAIIERRYAVFPQNSAPMTIEPVRFEAQIAANGRFGFDPFARRRVIRKQSDAIEINPQPVPADFSGQTWLPARQLLLVESSPDANSEYRVGEPITRMLTLQATGLSAAQLPEIRSAIPASIRQYPDQPTLENRVSKDGIVGIRHEKMALIPSEPGMVTLPAIEIPWWNTATNQMEVASLPARTIQIAAAAGGNASATIADPALTAPVPGESDSSDAGSNNATPLANTTDGNTIWPWLSLALATGWLATLLAWSYNHRRNRQQPANPKPGKIQTSEKQLLKDLRGACETNDAAAAKTALLQWAALQWPGNRINSLGELAARFDGELPQQLHRLSQHLYSPASSAWDGKGLWQSFADRPQQQPASKAEPCLEPLYH